MKVQEVIRRPLVTEKSAARQALNQYFFAVHRKATKIDIRLAIEHLFKVTVMAVQTQQVWGKRRRVGRHTGWRSDWKKAIVTIKAGERIPLFEGA